MGNYRERSFFRFIVYGAHITCADLIACARKLDCGKQRRAGSALRSSAREPGVPPEHATSVAAQTKLRCLAGLEHQSQIERASRELSSAQSAEGSQMTEMVLDSVTRIIQISGWVLLNINWHTAGMVRSGSGLRTGPRWCR